MELVLTPAQGQIRQLFEVAGVIDLLPFPRIAGPRV
jgi:hypothetical protein